MGAMAQEDHGRRARRPGDLERDQADRAVAHDRDRVAEADAGLPDRPHGDLGRLDESRLLVADLGGQPEALPGRHLDVFREATIGVQADRGPVDAQRVLVATTVVALPAEEADVRDDPVADGNPLDLRSDLDDLAGELMAERDRGTLSRERVRAVHRDDDRAVAVLLEVGPADAAPAHPEEDLAGAHARDRDVLDAHIATSMPASRPHRGRHVRAILPVAWRPCGPASVTLILTRSEKWDHGV